MTKFRNPDPLEADQACALSCDAASPDKFRPGCVKPNLWQNEDKF